MVISAKCQDCPAAQVPRCYADAYEAIFSLFTARLLAC